MEVELETKFKVGDRVQITKDQHWSGVGRKGKDLIPAGSAGTLGKYGGLWIIRFDKYRVPDEWPCLIGFYDAKLPPWVVRIDEEADIRVSETRVTNEQLWNLIWQM
jgi:hypothetical protein